MLSRSWCDGGEARVRPGPARRLIWIAGGLVLAALVVFALDLHSGSLRGALALLFDLSPDDTVRQLRAWGRWSAAGSILLMVLHSFLPFPAEVIAFANGAVFGLFWGTVVTWVGAMLGACLAFALARRWGRPLVVRMVAERHHAAVDRWSRLEGGTLLFCARLIPVISFNLINYAAGLTAISWLTFLWATGLGILPITVLSVLLGDRMMAPEAGFWLWVSLGGAVVLGIVLLVRRWRHRLLPPPGEGR